VSRAHARQRAREALAAATARRGPGYANLAESIRTGFANVWVECALDALEPLVLLSGDDGEAYPEEDRRTEAAHRG
jgi:TPP-dependent trihydroxycyclohexane-1,2-dione (THcHDO) dehydratase